MDEYVKAALFVYNDDGRIYLDDLENNEFGTVISGVTIEEMRQDPEKCFALHSHVVVSASLREIKEVITAARDSNCSFGLLPLESQKTLEKCYSLPRESKGKIELALRGEPSPIDLLYCNGSILFYKGVIGDIPLFDNRTETGRLKIIWSGLRRLFSLQLLPFTIRAFGKEEQKIETAAIGCVVLESHETGLLASLIEKDCSYCDGMISMLIMAPFSIFDYLRMIWARLVGGSSARAMANSLGLLRCPEIEIITETQKQIIIDDDEMVMTPATLRVDPGGFRLNTGLAKDVLANEANNAKEKYRTGALPAGKELVKASEKRLPFFTYASEQRFKELFSALRSDSELDTTYTVLMLLSTIIATVGLYLDSASVIIGAMLLAPLMAPIISMAMGLLRYDQEMFNKSLVKIVVGIFLALGASAAFTLLSPYQPITGEMQGRLNPSLLDLIVAIVAGIAGAYTKSYKEILQSMAGVAIAVALVPPLSVAGIGLGRLDLAFFFHAFLLFFTNLIGIVIAATITFRILGFSPAVKNRKSLVIFTGLLAVILIPLYLAFQGIVEQSRFEKNWKIERFMVNGKYLIVEKADLHTMNKIKVLTVDILARQPLDRRDLNEFKRKVKRNFSDELVIRANITYIP